MGSSCIILHFHQSFASLSSQADRLALFAEVEEGLDGVVKVETFQGLGVRVVGKVRHGCHFFQAMSGNLGGSRSYLRTPGICILYIILSLTKNYALLNAFRVFDSLYSYKLAWGKTKQV